MLALSRARLPAAAASRAARRLSSFGPSAPPMNFGLHIVPQQTAYVVERFGKFRAVLPPGIHLLIPLVDKVAYVHNLKEEAITVPSQTAITKDNVSIAIDGILYIRVVDAYKASYGIDDAHFAITQLAQTTMRSELGKISLDRTFQEREALNANIVDSINLAAEPWGVQCMRYELRDITPPKAVRAAMELEAEAERRKRAAVLDSEGDRDAAINGAEAAKRATILASEASKQERINLAEAEAAATLAAAGASAQAVERLAAAIGGAPHAQHAVALRVAEQYIRAFGQIAKAGNTVVLPANIADAPAAVASALSLYRTMVSSSTAGGGGGGGGGGGEGGEPGGGVGTRPGEAGDELGGSVAGGGGGSPMGLAAGGADELLEAHDLLRQAQRVAATERMLGGGGAATGAAERAADWRAPLPSPQQQRQP